ncbi:hypothetical protein LIER_03353 [Lithospermum erythrorhizon]|uniref:Secreted protein n=1 Tax=Lithospermum erythrorhizon TaxID=34254 RepID=A0AAV3NU49_LITER
MFFASWKFTVHLITSFVIAFQGYTLRIGGLVALRSPAPRSVNWLVMAKSLLLRSSSSAKAALRAILG